MIPVTIAVDVMGGDFGPQVTVPAALDCLSDHMDLHLLLVGVEEQVEAVLPKQAGYDESRVRLVHASEVVDMQDRPSDAMRKKKDSSMRVAANLVKTGEADAFVSAGNTGALMAISRFVLKTLPDIERPAIISAIPTINGHCHMLDLGANVDCDADNFYQFALMGSVLSQALDGVDRPKIGLLNIGEEEIKGNEQVRQANERLLASQDLLNYIGYVEGDMVYAGVADVVVCDGFVGNVALKTSEGLAHMITHAIREEMNRSWWTRILSAPALPLWGKLRRRLDPGRYNGASMVGLRGIAVKSHGNADRASFAMAVRRAFSEVRNNIPKLIEEGILEAESRAYLEPFGNR